MEKLISIATAKSEDTKTHKDIDVIYEKWKQRVAFISTINNYITIFFLVVHPLVMVVAYDFWANYHFLLIAHSG